MKPGIASIAGMVGVMALLTVGCASDEMKASSDSSMSSSSQPTEMKSVTGPSMSSTSTPSTPARSASSSPTMSSKNMDRIASGSVEDSLDACLARIPKESSSGQRMLAEQSCRRDQAAR